MEEQSEELEVLTSIFPEELTVLGTSPHHFRIHLVPNPGSGDNHVGVFLLFTLPPEYPGELAPETEIEIEKGLGKKHVEELKEVIDKVASENIGMPSIFTITEAAREWLRDNNVAGQDGSMYADMMRRMQSKDTETKKKAAQAAIQLQADRECQKVEEATPEELERIRRRQAGKPCTVESFLEWKAKFDSENNGAGGFSSVVFGNAGSSSSKASGSGVEEQQVTGKQWFLQNTAERISKAGTEGEDEEALIAAGEMEDFELDEEMLSKWACEAAFEDIQDVVSDDEDEEDTEAVRPASVCANDESGTDA